MLGIADETKEGGCGGFEVGGNLDWRKVLHFSHLESEMILAEEKGDAGLEYICCFNDGYLCELYDSLAETPHAIRVRTERHLFASGHD
jgi:hypothetical protein